MHDRAGTQPVEWIGPRGPIAQADRVVIAVGKTKPHEQAARGFGPQRVDQLLSQQAHRGRAEDDDALLVEPNDAFIRPKIEQFGELQTTIVHRSTILRRTDGVQRISRSSGEWKSRTIVGFLRIFNRLPSRRPATASPSRLDHASIDRGMAR